MPQRKEVDYGFFVHGVSVRLSASCIFADKTHKVCKNPECDSDCHVGSVLCLWGTEVCAPDADQRAVQLVVRSSDER